MSLQDYIFKKCNRKRRITHLYQIIKPLSIKKHTENPKKIVIGRINKDSFYYSVESVFCFFLRELGHKVHFLIDDGCLPHLDATTGRRHFDRILSGTIPPDSLFEFIDCRLSDQVSAKDRIRNLCFYALRPFFASGILDRFLDRYDMKVHRYSSLFEWNAQDRKRYRDRLEDLRSGNLSGHIIASHRRFFGGRPFSPDNPYHLRYAEYSLKNEMINRRVADRVVADYDPDLYITLDGTYTSRGPQVDRMKEAGVPVRVYKPDGFGDRTIFIGNRPGPVYNTSSHWDAYVNRFDSDEARKVERYLDQKIGSLNEPLPDTDRVRELERKTDRFDRTVGLFPNKPWDGALHERDVLFESMTDWMVESVSWAKERNVLLVIREHPTFGETYSRFQSTLAILREACPEVENIDSLIMIPGTESLSSYKIADRYLDCCAVYSSTISVEFAYIGLPVILAANSPYRGRGIGFEPSSRTEYDQLLGTISRDHDRFRSRWEAFRENALKAAGFQFFGNSHYHPLFPLKKYFSGPKSLESGKYWHSWALEDLNPARCDRWRSTLTRLFEPVLDG